MMGAEVLLDILVSGASLRTKSDEQYLSMKHWMSCQVPRQRALHCHDQSLAIISEGLDKKKKWQTFCFRILNSQVR